MSVAPPCLPPYSEEGNKGTMSDSIRHVLSRGLPVDP